MTAIVGIEHSGHVFLGGDRAVSDDDALTVCAHPKVWRRGGLVFGGAGQLDSVQKIYYHHKPPRYRGTDPALYVGRLLVPSLAAVFSGGTDLPLSLLVGCGGELFSFDSGLAFSRVGPEWAVGSGADAARAALRLLPDTLDPRERVRRALEVSAHVCLSVAPPFDVLSA